MIIAYTLGSTKNYDEALKLDPTTKKLGKNEDYEGGWVWKSKEDAEIFLQSQNFLEIDWGDGKCRNPNDFSVYGLFINDWEIDTCNSENDNNYHLLIDAQLFILDRHI